MRTVAETAARNVGTVEYQKVGAMLPETAKVLDDFYRPFIHQFADMLNDKRFLWLDQAH